MPEDISPKNTKSESSFGYHDGEVENIISVEDVNRQAQEIAETVGKEKIAGLVEGDPFFEN